MAKSFSEIIDGLIGSVTTAIGNIDVRVGTVLRDSFLAPVSFEFSKTYTEIDTTSANQGLLTAAQQSDASLENLASNFNITRSTGGYSSGTIRFLRYTQPTNNIEVPVGTRVYSESQDEKVSFRTLTTVYLTPTSPQEPGINAYYVDCPVICDITGEIGNVVAGGITYVEIVGIDAVYNPNDFTGGKDTQSNDDLVATIRATAQGNLGTITGYEALVRQNFSVTDVKVISARDADAVRAQYGGSIDIIVLDETQTEVTESYPFVDASTTVELVPTFKPVLSVVQIMGKNIDNEDVALVAGVDYTPVYDVFTIDRRSINEKSKVALHITSFEPLPNSILTMRYTYSLNTGGIQDFLSQEERYVLGSDVLVKVGIVVPVNIVATIKIFPGYAAETVKQEIVDALTAHFSALLLNQSVQASDVITVMSNVAGVDSVVTGTFVLAKSEFPAVNLEEVSANKQEYIRLNPDPSYPQITVVT